MERKQYFIEIQSHHLSDVLFYHWRIIDTQIAKTFLFQESEKDSQMHWIYDTLPPFGGRSLVQAAGCSATSCFSVHIHISINVHLDLFTEGIGNVL